MKPKLIILVPRQGRSQQRGERKLQSSFPEGHRWQSFTINYFQIESNSVLKRSYTIIKLFSLQGWKAGLAPSNQYPSWTLGDSCCMISPADAEGPLTDLAHLQDANSQGAGKKHETVSFTGKWIALEINMFSEITGACNGGYDCFLSYMGSRFK